MGDVVALFHSCC